MPCYNVSYPTVGINVPPWSRWRAGRSRTSCPQPKRKTWGWRRCWQSAHVSLHAAQGMIEGRGEKKEGKRGVKGGIKYTAVDNTSTSPLAFAARQEPQIPKHRDEYGTQVVPISCYQLGCPKRRNAFSRSECEFLRYTAPTTNPFLERALETDIFRDLYTLKRPIYIYVNAQKLTKKYKHPDLLSFVHDTQTYNTRLTTAVALASSYYRAHY